MPGSSFVLLYSKVAFRKQVDSFRALKRETGMYKIRSLSVSLRICLRLGLGLLSLPLSLLIPLSIPLPLPLSFSPYVLLFPLSSLHCYTAQVLTVTGYVSCASEVLQA